MGGPKDPQAHPVLVEEIIERDASHSTHLRVFCTRDGAMTPLAACEACQDCLQISAAANQIDAVVVCKGDSAREISAAVAALPVGQLLTTHTLCVRRDMPLSSAISLFAERALASVLVVDEQNRLVGCLRDIDLVTARPGGDGTTVAAVMSSATAVVEVATLKAAVLRMAAHHVRSVAVISARGELLGVLKDLDALRLLASIAPPVPDDGG